VPAARNGERAIQEGLRKPTMYAPLARTVSIRASPLPLAYRLTLSTGVTLLPGPRAALHFRLSTRDSRSTENKQRHALQRLSEREGVPSPVRSSTTSAGAIAFRAPTSTR
jgi:hypothetical protein